MSFTTLQSVVETMKLEQARLLAEQARQFPRQPEIDLARAQAAAHQANAEKESKDGVRVLGIVRSRASVAREQQARQQARAAYTTVWILEREKSSWETQVAARLSELSYDLTAASTVLNEAMQKARRAERERRQAEEARRKKAREVEEKQSIAARLAAAGGASRILARSVRAGMLKCDRCPYCQTWMPSDAECDHIVPMAKGGLSAASNMVYVCKSCNQSKGEMTLFQFCRTRGYDFLQVVARLEKAGKIV